MSNVTPDMRDEYFDKNGYVADDDAVLAWHKREMEKTVRMRQKPNPKQRRLMDNKNDDVLDSLQHFQEERELHKQPFDLKVASKNILEELLEAHGVSDNKDRDLSSALLLEVEEIVKEVKAEESFTGTSFKEPTIEDTVDAFCDITTFSGGEVGKLGYSFKLALAEVSKEINSREGEIVDGKFTKFKTPEAMARWYKARFDNARLH